MKLLSKHSHEQQIAVLQQLLVNAANAERAAGAKAYMKNHFEFLGIPMPERRRNCKEWIRSLSIVDEQHLVVLVENLWKLNEREYQYGAIELLAFHKKLWSKNTIDLMEQCIVSKSWWDTVDFIAAEWCGPYFQVFPDLINKRTAAWNRSENIWLQRSSLLFQKSYKKATDLKLLSKYIEHLANSKEFFIRKAIGWVLREYAKTDAVWVQDFVNTHTLSPLSEREALKHVGK